MDGGEEGLAVFGVSCCNAAPSFEVQERVFDQVTQFVQVFVIWPLLDAIFLRGNHGVHALRGGLLKDRVGIIALVRDKMICINALDQP